MEPIFVSYAQTAEMAAYDFAVMYFDLLQTVATFEGNKFNLQGEVQIYRVLLNAAEKRWEIFVEDNSK